MKKAICFLKMNDEKSNSISIEKAKEYALEKGYEYAGDYQTTPRDIVENGEEIMSVLKERNIEVILTDNELPLYSKIFEKDSLLQAADSEGIQWFDVDNDCLVNSMIEGFFKEVEKEMLARHIPVMVVFEGTSDFEKDSSFQKIVMYMKTVLNQDMCTVVQFNEDTENVRENLIHSVLKYMPNHIIVNKEIESESVKIVLDKIKNALDDDRIISFNEVEEALNDNVILSISDLKH